MTITPCVEILHHLTTDVNISLGSRQGNHHASPDLTKDIQTLVSKLYEYHIYTEDLGHTLGEDGEPATNAISAGYDALS